MRRRWGNALVVLLVVGAVLVPALPAGAQRDEDTGWVVQRFDARLHVEPDGTVRVEEEIAVDFDDLERHGIFRVIPVQYAIAEGDAQVEVPEGREASDFRRVLAIEGLEVEGTAPAEIETSREDDDLVIRIGDPDQTVTGQQTYRLRYRVRGALDAVADLAELDWNVTGDSWPVPIQTVSASVAGPDVREGSCARGRQGATTPCDQALTGDGRATFSTGTLQPGEGLTVAAAFPLDEVAVPPALIEERWRLSRALTGSPLALPLAAVTTLVGLAGVVLLALRGRDEMGVDGTDGMPAGLRTDPPEGLRPAQLCVLLDERIDEAGLSATIADLAARGFLEIEQVPPEDDGRGQTDWRLRRRSEGDEGELLDYERVVLEALLGEQDVVELSDVQGEFHDEYGRFRRLVYADAVERGWFARDPASTRARWLGFALVALLVTAVLFGLALAFTELAVAVLPLLLAAVVLLVVQRSMPRRTRTGRRLLAEARGFRSYLTSTGVQQQPALQEDPAVVFGRDLPYAMAFGATPLLVSRFRALGVPPQQWTPSWYHYPLGYAAWDHDPSSMAADLGSFADAVGSGLATAPSSSSSSGGVAGGGFGGGGGGSW